MKFNFDVLDKCRWLDGPYKTNPGETYGAFLIPYQSYHLKVLATDGEGYEPRWEHVSVSLPNRCPNWEEMCFVKDLFWAEDETVVQFHPRKDSYVNRHKFCLHLWRNPNKGFHLPPTIYIG